MYDELWQDEEREHNDAWCLKKVGRGGGELIVWIRHEATYSAIRPRVTERPKIGESRVMSGTDVQWSSESFNVPGLQRNDEDGRRGMWLRGG